LVEAVGTAAATAEGEAARGAIQQIGVADQDAEVGAARNLLWDANDGLSTRAGRDKAEQYADSQGLSGAASPFSSHALSMVNDLRPGMLRPAG